MACEPDATPRLIRPFKPPFPHLAIVVWGFFVFCHVVHPESTLWRHSFLDSDDYLHMLQALDLVHGQRWYDMYEHRMNPPAGTYIHFLHTLSPLYVVPILALRPFMTEANAIFVTAMIWPPIYFAIFLFVARKAAEPLISRAWVNFTAFTALFSLWLIFQFIPGRADHHGLLVTIALAAFACLTRVMIDPQRLRLAAAAGLLLALGLVIGLEILPALLLMTLWLGLWAIVNGEPAARTGLLYGLSLFVGATLFLLPSKPPAIWLSDMPVEAYSFTYVVLAAGITVCFAGVYLTSRLTGSIVTKFIASGAVALCVGALFFHAFPSLKTGPYGGVDPVIRELILKRSRESWSIIYSHRFWPALPTLLALALSPAFIRNQKGNARWGAGLLVLILAMMLLLMIFYQVRLNTYASAFIVIPMAFLGERALALASRQKSPVMRRAIAIMGLLAAGPLMTVILPGLPDAYGHSLNVLLFPVQVTENACDDNGVIQVLNDRYGDRPRLIMNAMSDSTPILLYTKHSILAAPYHMNIVGNVDSTDFFTSTNWDEAEKIIRRRGAELVMICSVLEPIYNVPDPKGDPMGKANPNYLAEQLVDDDASIPEWLNEVDDDRLDDIRLFEVAPPPHN